MKVDQEYKNKYIARLTGEYGFSHEMAAEDFYATIEEEGFEASDPELDADEAASYYNCYLDW